jgi:uncharacterized phage infection (PIP) family protein YhgE
MELSKIELITNEIQQERNLLESVLDTMKIFLKNFKDTKDVLELVYDDTDKLDEYSKNINNASSRLAELLENHSNVNENLPNIIESLTQLFDKFSSLVEMEDEIIEISTKLKSFLEVFENIEFNKFSSELNEVISKTDELFNIIDSANAKFSFFEEKIKKIEEENKKQQIVMEKLVEQSMITNELLEKIYQRNNRDVAELFEIMDEWYETKRK